MQQQQRLGPRFHPRSPLPPPATFRLCVECRHFRRDIQEHGAGQTRRGRCDLFGELELTTGHVLNDLASDCRADEGRCGQSGAFFAKK